MADEEDEGITPIPTDSILGGGGPPDAPSDDQGVTPIETDIEQRGGGGDGEHNR